MSNKAQPVSFFRILRLSLNFLGRQSRVFAWVGLIALFASPPILANDTGAATVTGKRIVQVGIDPHSEPFTFVDAQKKPAGFSIDLLNAIAKERGFETNYIVEPWPQILEQLRAGELDMVASIGYLPKRDAYADFSIPFASLESAIMVRSGDLPFNSLEDLRGRRIAVAKESIAQDFTQRHHVDQYLVFTPSIQESLTKLSSGQVDAVLTARWVAAKAMRELGLRGIEPAGVATPDLRYEMHMAVPNGRSALLFDLNMGLYTLRQNGVYDSLYEKWLGVIEPRRLRWQDFAPFRWPIIVVIAILSFAFWRQRKLLGRLKSQAGALKLSEERLTLVLEGSQDAFWDWDLKTGEIVRSQRWAEIIGCTLQEIPSHISGFDTMMHPDDIPLLHRARQHILAEGHHRVEYRLKAKDGTWRWIFDRGQVVARDHSGQPLRVTGAATDVTARKQTEEALARSQVLLEQTQQATEIGGWEYNVQSNTLFWTKQTFRIHDLDPVGNAPSLERALDFFTPASQPILLKAVDRAISEGTAFNLELELITAQGRLIWLKVVGRAERDNTRTNRIYGSYQNITGQIKSDEERQKLQLKMLEAQKLESLGVLAGGIAHDFNNLLTVILGNASMAREEPELSAEALKQIETASHRAADLCRQMLAYAGKSRFSLETLNLNAVVEDTVQLLKMSISKNAILEFELLPNSVPVEADASQLRQVIMNLVINASDALISGPGCISVRTDIEHLTPETLHDARLGQDLPAGEYVLLEVEDNGCGMSSDTMSRIFDPFFTTKFTGRGLGLAAVLGIVRAHHGAFFVRSTLGRGSLFRMAIPISARPMPNNSLHEPHAASPAKATGTILVVDDEPSVRKFASVVLERRGYSTAVANDGYEALALALAHGVNYTAVLLDLTMPGLDGPATLKELRVLNTSLPVLLMSGFSEADAKKHFSNDPYVSFIPKPFTGEVLLARLDALLASSAALSGARKA